MIYWDTSCVIKLYTAESDSPQWQAQAMAATDELVASSLLEVELAFAFEQKELRGEVKKDGAKALLQLFRHDLHVGRFALYPIGTDVLAAAVSIANRCYHAESPIHVRTLDGVHLATAVGLKARAIATVDRRMQAAAGLLRIPVVAATS